MRLNTVVISLILATLSGAGSQANDCNCVYPWPEECNKVCFQASGTVESFEKNKAVLAVGEKRKESFEISNDAEGKDNLRKGNQVKVFGHMEGSEKVVTDVKPLQKEKKKASQREDQRPQR